jgi:hypothetical protein
MAGIQTTYPTTRALGFAGGLADSGPHDTKSVVAAVAIAAGLLVVKGDVPAKGYLPAGVDAADPDAILATGGASAATAQTVSGVALDGVVGTDRLGPTRNLVLVLSSHADWDATAAVVTGLDEDGDVIQETFLIPNGGNVTVTGVRHFASVTSIYIPAQSGTGGTFTLGTGALIGVLAARYIHGVAVYDAAREPEAYPIGYVVPCARKGRVFVVSETSYEDGDSVYVRFVATGNEVAGQFRATPDANDCALVKGARFWRTGSAGVAAIDLNLS